MGKNKSIRYVTADASIIPFMAEAIEIRARVEFTQQWEAMKKEGGKEFKNSVEANAEFDEYMDELMSLIFIKGAMYGVASFPMLLKDVMDAKLEEDDEVGDEQNN